MLFTFGWLHRAGCEELKVENRGTFFVKLLLDISVLQILDTILIFYFNLLSLFSCTYTALIRKTIDIKFIKI